MLALRFIMLVYLPMHFTQYKIDPVQEHRSRKLSFGNLLLRFFFMMIIISSNIKLQFCSCIHMWLPEAGYLAVLSAHT